MQKSLATYLHDLAYPIGQALIVFLVLGYANQAYANPYGDFVQARHRLDRGRHPQFVVA